MIDAEQVAEGVDRRLRRRKPHMTTSQNQGWDDCHRIVLGIVREVLEIENANEARVRELPPRRRQAQEVSG